MKHFILILAFICATLIANAQEFTRLGEINTFGKRADIYRVDVLQSKRSSKLIYLMTPDAPHFEVPTTPFIIAKKKFRKELDKAIETAEQWTETANQNNIKSLNKQIAKYNLNHLTQFVGISPEHSSDYWLAGLIIGYMKIYDDVFITLYFTHEHSILSTQLTLPLADAKKLAKIISEENIAQKVVEQEQMDQLFEQ